MSAANDCVSTVVRNAIAARTMNTQICSPKALQPHPNLMHKTCLVAARAAHHCVPAFAAHVQGFVRVSHALTHRRLTEPLA